MNALASSDNRPVFLNFGCRARPKRAQRKSEGSSRILLNMGTPSGIPSRRGIFKTLVYLRTVLNHQN